MLAPLHFEPGSRNVTISIVNEFVGGEGGPLVEAASGEEQRLSEMNGQMAGVVDGGLPQLGENGPEFLGFKKTDFHVLDIETGSLALSEGIGLVEELIEEGEGGFDLEVMGSRALVGERIVVFGNPISGQGGGVQALGGGPGDELGPGAAVGGEGRGGEPTIRSLEKAI